MLHWRAISHPGILAYTFLQDGESEQVQLSYQELDRQAQTIVAHLQKTVAPGARALLLYPRGLDYIAAFFGCLYARVIAVPAYPPQRNQRSRTGARLQSITQTAQPASPALAKGWRDEQPVQPETLAFLQYTSGSTATFKGVMVSHGNLLHNEWLIQHAFGHTEQAKIVGWLTLYHDAEPDDRLLLHLDLSEHSATEAGHRIATSAAELHASLDLADGPLLRAAIFDLGPDQPQRLLLIIHHLAGNGLSWRVLVDDLQTAYEQLRQEQPVALPTKTTAFKYWAELGYWRDLAQQEPVSLPVDRRGGQAGSVALNAEATQALLQTAPAAYQTQSNDLLLTALGQSCAEWTGSPRLRIDLEGQVASRSLKISTCRARSAGSRRSCR